jgi:maltose alpha-D-glucosyltransferase/alpha-amylase
MNWYQKAVFYELYLRAYKDGDHNGHGDFIGLREKLDYLQWLGVDCIWLLPVYPSPLNDDGYDIASFYGIHPDFGLLEDFRMTVEEIHRRGMRIIADLVVNHTSDQHPWFKEARRSVNSPMRDWYVWSETGEEYSDTRIIFLDTEKSNWAYDERSGQYYWHRFYSNQPDLNYDNHKVQQAMLDVMRFWLDLGIDGFRVDAVPYLYEREGTNCENLPETHDFLKRMRALVDAHYNGRLLLGEANQWPQDVVPYFGDERNPEFHMNFHFPLMPRLYMALAKADNSSIIDILNQTPKTPQGSQWATFLRNHDELTLEMVTEEERQFMWDYYAPEPAMRLNLGIRRRLAPLMNNDRRKIMLMHSLLFTLPGTPMLYYGDEIGMGDDLKQFDRNGVRTPMQWSSGRNGGFSEAPPEMLYIPTINDPLYGYTSINVEDQIQDPQSQLNAVREMILTYKRYTQLTFGKLQWLEDQPQTTLCFWLKQDDDETKYDMLILHNLGEEPIKIALPEGRYTDVLRSENAPIQENITLEPYAYHWLIKHPVQDYFRE